MPGISRAQVAMKAGQRVLQLATAANLEPGHFQLARRSVLDDLQRLVESCREARGMYLNYPKLRSHLLASADVIQDLADQLSAIPAHSAIEHRTKLAFIGTKLRMYDFSPPTDEPYRASGHPAPLDPVAELQRQLEQAGDPSDDRLD